MSAPRWIHAYARAVAAAAGPTDRLDALATELERWARTFAALPEWAAWSEQPVPRADRLAVLDRLGADRADPIVARLLARLACWNHLHLLPGIAAAVTERRRRAAGRVRARVTSAAPLPDPLVTMLREQGRRLAGARACELETAVNPGLRAGFVLHVDDWELDYSLSGRLRRLRRAWLAPMGRPLAAPGSSTP